MTSHFVFKELEKAGVTRLEFSHHLSLVYNPGKDYEAKVIDKEGEEIHCYVKQTDEGRFNWVWDGTEDDCRYWPICNIEDFRMIGLNLAYFCWNEQCKEVMFNF